jgi:hypothetical protein
MPYELDNMGFIAVDSVQSCDYCMPKRMKNLAVIFNL